MKEITFYITLNIRTPNGFEMFGKFQLGTDKEFAYDVFSQLEGNDGLSENDILHIDMMEMQDELPLNVKVRTCSLDQLAHNTRIITKEIFKAYNMEES